MRRIKIKTKRALDASRSADSAVLGLRARRAQAAMARGGVRPPSPEEIERFAVGGCNGGCSTPPMCPPQPTGVLSCNDCYRQIAEEYRCRLTVASGGQVAVAGQSRIVFPIEPAQSNFFLPLYVRLSARDTADPTQLMMWRLSAVTIKNTPQESYHETNPDATTVVGVESTAYDTRTSGGLPGVEVAWAPFSRRALSDHIELIGWNPHGPDVQLDVHAEIWGYPLDQLPDGWKCGVHPGTTQQPRKPTPNNNGNPVPVPSSSAPVG